MEHKLTDFFVTCKVKPLNRAAEIYGISLNAVGTVKAIDCDGYLYISWDSSEAETEWHYYKNFCLVESLPVEMNLKELNTRIDAIMCAKCNGKLKDPGMGPKYKFCPNCEP